MSKTERAGESFFKWVEEYWKLDKVWRRAERFKGGNEKRVPYHVFKEAALNEFDKIVDSILRKRMSSRVYDSRRDINRQGNYKRKE